MIEVDEFNRVCRLAGLMRIKDLNKWTTEKKEEGIELNIQNKIRTFTYKDGECDFDAIISDHRIQNVLGAFEKEIEEQKTGKKEDKKDEIHETKKEEEKAVEKVEKPGIMPELLTKSLYEKWQGRSISERLIMLQKTDPSQIEERKGRTGQKYKYVSISYMIKAANMAFGFAWSVRVVSWIETATEIICNIELIAEIDGKSITKAATGQKDIAFRQNSKEVLCKGDDYKSAESDAIKKALSLFGVAQDVYSGGI